ncbi:PREDICTED: cadherin-related family member 5 [Myotis davidii]|uniref:cadherin-related family member 5 n=1 Tax=Myotis davidii TaxID=225400 RepID=UPI0007672904|nr:PREDICTED: cadherin-related family member 5 [Myotis davidii]
MASGAMAQAQGCSVNQTLFQIEENTVLSGPLVDIQVPQGQQVTLGRLSTPHAFRIQGNQLFLNVTPDYEDRTMLLADLECRRGDTVVSQLKVFVTVLDVNDNPPVFPFEVKTKKVPEDTKVNTIVIPQEELAATDLDKSDILPHRPPQPGSRLTVGLGPQDTPEEGAVPSHSATASLVLEVQPVDRRPPRFLPCLYSDLLICVQAQYHGAIPTGHRLPAPLTLRPGPIYAVDGDRGINQRIIYSILRGNEDGTFVLNADSGNLTMARSVPRPRTFLLLVKGEQEDGARYSVTQVTIEARAAAGSFSAITYEITNNSDFRMDGEAVLTAARLGQAGVFYAEVQAKNTVTAGTATTVVEIQVSEQEPPPTGPPGSPTPPETGRTTRPSSSSTSEPPRPPEPSQGPSTTSSGGSTGPHTPSGTSTPEPPRPSQGPSTTSSGGSTGLHSPSSTSTLEPPRSPKPSQGPSTTSSGGSMGPHPPLSTSTPEAPRPPKTSQGPSTTSSGGSMGPHPPSGTTLKPSALSTTPGGPSSVGTSTSPSSASSSGGSQQTSKPGSTGAGGTGDGGYTDQRFSAVEMGVLGGVLGSLLLLALLALVILLHKHYGPWFRCCSSKALEAQPYGFDNKAFPR